jgi:hypothetical protein
MGQQEVYDFLMNNPDQWYTSKQISEKLIVSIGSVTMSLKKLRKTNIIKFRNTGKRNTFQYMVQSEPAKLAETKIDTKPMLLEPMRHVIPEPTKLKVKIKPKVVHQHTFLGGQTFYGVIRGKEETDAITRARDERIEAAEAKIKTVRRTAKPKPKHTMRAKSVRSKPVLRKKLTAGTRKKVRAKVKPIKRATIKKVAAKPKTLKVMKRKR